MASVKLEHMEAMCVGVGESWLLNADILRRLNCFS
jgi:hypothetical protein